MISVIILNYNVCQFLEMCILSVQQALGDLKTEIIVVDNNSSDGSCVMVRSRFPDVILIENKENLGFPKGNNIGVAAATGEYICILNPDTVVTRDTFSKAMGCFCLADNIGIVGVRLIDGRGHFLRESKRGVPTPFVAFTKVAGLYKLSKLFGRYYAEHLDSRASGPVDILPGAFMMMKRELYLEVGGFDEDCFMYSDDIDLSYQVLKSGRQNYYLGATSIIHYKGESTIRDGLYMQRFREAMEFFYKKNFKPSPVLSWMMKLGTIWFSAVKRLEGNRLRVKPWPERYFLISDSEELKNELEEQFGQRVHRQTRYQQPFFSPLVLQGYKCMYIFDNNHINFTTIVGIMDLNRNPNVIFRIMPMETDFIIGSDSSVDRGEVMRLKGFYNV